MEYLKEFGNHNTYDKSKLAPPPNVSFCKSEEHLHYSEENHYFPGLCFEANVANSSLRIIKSGSTPSILTATLEYKLNNEEWQHYTFGTYINLTSKGDVVSFRGTNATFSSGAVGYYKFQMSGEINAGGDITSLINGEGGDVLLPTSSFYGLFSGCTSLLTAPSLPSTSGGNSVYNNMFAGCSNLIEPPKTIELKTINNYGCSEMFKGCSSLKETPLIKATTVNQYGCNIMFENCSSLETAKDINVTSVSNRSFLWCFRNCTSLTKAPTTLPAKTLAVACYYGMFYNCSNLEVAPIIPALKAFGDSSFYQTFRNCTKLNYVKALFTIQINPSNATYEWLRSVSQTGTFIKSSNASWSTTGVDGVPLGWTIVYE